MRRRQIRQALRAMDAASSYEEWLAAAQEVDTRSGLAEWRQEDDSAYYDQASVHRVIRRMRALQASRSPRELADVLHTSLHRHLTDLLDAGLYDTAYAGTKHLVSLFLDEATQAMDWLCDTDFPGISLQTKLRLFRRTRLVFGRSALMLSGGATLGFHHMGVVKALFEQGLLPSVLSGASMGAMIAAGIAARTDEELRALFAHPEEVAREGLGLSSMRHALGRRALLDPEVLYKTILHNVGEHTFEAAYARTGRVVNISVSPTRRRQKPRVLCHLTSPDVLLASAALASSAVPGLFPAVALRRRRVDGQLDSYLPQERWIDGSMRGDLPMMRVGRLHNVNHFIVSQTNPHVVPFMGNRQQRGVLGWGRQAMGKAVHRQGVQVVGALRHLGGGTPIGPALDVAHALWSQDYQGDVNIVPPVPLSMYRKVVSNPSLEDLKAFIRGGEQGTWPAIVRIRDTTRVARTLGACVARLEARAEA